MSEPNDHALTVPRPQWEETLEALSDPRTNSVTIPRNKRAVTRERVVSSFLDAFELIGGTPRLALWGNENPTEFYRLFSKLMPKEQTTKQEGEVRVLHVIPPTALDGDPPIGEHPRPDPTHQGELIEHDHAPPSNLIPE